MGGKIQFDLWQEFNLDDKAKSTEKVTLNEELFDWQGLRAKLKEFGVRNSLLTAPMPTASTSQILGNNECFEPYTSNVYVRRTLAGEFVCINDHLLRDLIKLGIWNPLLKDKLIAANGSVQKLEEVPEECQQIYKTVWEISQKQLINMAADRGHFIDQSQSFNIHMNNPNFGKLTSMHFYGWRIGLKTGMYYLRTKAAVDAIKYTIPYSEMQIVDNRKKEKLVKEERKTRKVATTVVSKKKTAYVYDDDEKMDEVVIKNGGDGKKHVKQVAHVETRKTARVAVY